MAMIDYQFRPRLETLIKGLYSGDRLPIVQIKGDDSSASWIFDGSELMATSGEYNRLTKIVLLAHRLRLQVTFTALRNEYGCRIVVEPRLHAPFDPIQHHPGLSDLVEACYTLGGRPSELQEMANTFRTIHPLIKDELKSCPDLRYKIEGYIQSFCNKETP